MAIDTTLRSRRSLLAGTAGRVAALLYGALRPALARASDGDVIHVGDDLTGKRVTRLSTSTGGAFEGVSSGPRGVGVTGRATVADGGAVGVFGQSDSTAGAGVLGQATAISGDTRGVIGQSDSTEGIGVAGFAWATSGTTRGVTGQSDSTEGVGVLGSVTAADGHALGVVGQSTSTEGAGVWGVATSVSGTTFGVVGENHSDAGVGTLGWSAGDAIGVMGVSGPEPPPGAGTPGTGVYGVAAQDNGRGGVFIGQAARLRLVPVSTTHPPSGEMGDLFADTTGRLWFCKGDADWKQIA